jgi:hypothetical protein
MMDIYMLGLGIGSVGLGAMALSGVSHHAGTHASGGGHGSHLHVGHGHGAHAGHGQHAGAALHGHGHHAGAAAHGGDSSHAHVASGGASRFIWSLASPRVLFSFLVGFGAVGLIARPIVGGLLLFALAFVGGIAFETFAVAPLWNFLLRFASTPAVTLESSILDEARAASSFDTNGQGLVTIELDGQIRQILGTLRAEDRDAGIRVRGGDRLRVEEVDGERNRCTVSFLGR